LNTPHILTCSRYWWHKLITLKHLHASSALSMWSMVSFLLSYFNCVKGWTWMLTGTILHLCSFLLNGKGIDTRTSLRMVCFFVWTHFNAFILDCFKGVTPVCYIYVILFLRILDHRCPLVWLVFLNLGQIFFKLWVSSTVSI
jgi:hypothetical protein